jgi:hypothetical protein
MKNILIQYLWIFLITALLGVIMVFIYPEKKNRLEFIEEKIKEVEMKKKILTEKEKQLEKLATEKEWEEVDKEKDK